MFAARVTFPVSRLDLVAVIRRHRFEILVVVAVEDFLVLAKLAPVGELAGKFGDAQVTLLRILGGGFLDRF